MPKYRQLLKTLLDMENELLNPVEEPISIYK